MTSLPLVKKPSRDELPPGADLCSYCTGKCCRYISVPLDEPTDWEDFDAIRWYLTRKHVSVYVEKGCWYVMVHEDCDHLQPDYRCGIYFDRPKVCRDHKTDDCEYDEDYDYQLLFENDDQIWEYAEARLGPRVRSVELMMAGDQGNAS